MIFSLFIVIVASTGAVLASERVSDGSKHILINLLLTMVFWALAVLYFVHLLGASGIVVILSFPAVLLIGSLCRSVIKLSLVYFGLLSPEEV